MLDPPQKSVRNLERLARALRQRPALGENGQRMLGPAHTKVGLLAAANDLKRLRDEFDFPNAAGTELDVGRIAAAALLVANLPVNIAETFVRVVVQILAVDERRDPKHELVIATAGQRPCLEPCVALPGAALRYEVMLERGKRRRQRTAFAVGPQAHVDTKHVTVGGDFAQRGDDAPTEAIEEFAIGDRARTLRVAFLRIGEH